MPHLSGTGHIPGANVVAGKVFNGGNEEGFDVIGESDAIQRLRRMVHALARRDCTVLINGESGSGKELTARAIHRSSARRQGPFVPVDCTTLRDTLFESQLFGHVRGAFTGADKPTLGFFRSADRGTLFLDEIGELPLHMQAKLLRCIQEGEVVPLGAVTPVKVNVRIIAATHRDLSKMVQDGTFRADLFYRLHVACLGVPPLRERKQDIPLLVRQALADLAQLYNEAQKTVSPAAMHALHQYDWPGNVRELINGIEHALVFAANPQILPEDLPTSIRQGTGEPRSDSRSDGNDVVMTLDAAQQNAVERAMRAANGNQTRAAQMLAIERHRLRRILRRYQLEHLARPQSR
jgi:DNA-binding NtrC family response regulator